MKIYILYIIIYNYIMIIHISGTSGAGKSYIGNLFKKDCNVIDLDDWTEEFDKKKIKNNKEFIKFIRIIN